MRLSLSVFAALAALAGVCIADDCTPEKYYCANTLLDMEDGYQGYQQSIRKTIEEKYDGQPAKNRPSQSNSLFKCYPNAKVTLVEECEGACQEKGGDGNDSC